MEETLETSSQLSAQNGAEQQPGEQSRISLDNELLEVLANYYKNPYLGEFLEQCLTATGFLSYLEQAGVLPSVSVSTAAATDQELLLAKRKETLKLLAIGMLAVHFSPESIIGMV